METNNVLNINNVVDENTVHVTSTGTTAIAETAPLGSPGFTYTGDTYTIPSIWTTTSTYAVNLQVKRAVNGYVVEYAYATYIAKTEKELNKLIVQLLNPGKGKKHGQKT